MSHRPKSSLTGLATLGVGVYGAHKIREMERNYQDNSIAISEGQRQTMQGIQSIAELQVASMYMLRNVDKKLSTLSGIAWDISKYYERTEQKDAFLGELRLAIRAIASALDDISVLSKTNLEYAALQVEILQELATEHDVKIEHFKHSHEDMDRAEEVLKRLDSVHREYMQRLKKVVGLNDFNSLKNNLLEASELNNESIPKIKVMFGGKNHRVEKIENNISVVKGKIVKCWDSTKIKEEKANSQVLQATYTQLHKKLEDGAVAEKKIKLKIEHKQNLASVLSLLIPIIIFFPLWFWINSVPPAEGYTANEDAIGELFCSLIPGALIFFLLSPQFANIMVYSANKKASLIRVECFSLGGASNTIEQQLNYAKESLKSHTASTYEDQLRVLQNSLVDAARDRDKFEKQLEAIREKRDKLLNDVKHLIPHSVDLLTDCSSSI